MFSGSNNVGVMEEADDPVSWSAHPHQVLY
jgi:hypothetical protein